MQRVLLSFWGIEEQRLGGLQAGLQGLRSCLVDHTSLADSVRDFLCLDMNHDLDIYLRAIFTVVHDHTADFRSGTSNAVGTHSEMLCQDVSFILMHVDGRLAGLALEPLVSTFSDPFGPGHALAPLSRVVHGYCSSITLSLFHPFLLFL